MKKYKAIAIPVTFEDDRPRFLTVRDRRFKDWIFVTGGCRRREIYNPLRCALRELEEETRGVVSLKKGEYTEFTFIHKESPTVELVYNVYIFFVNYKRPEQLNLIKKFNDEKTRTNLKKINKEPIKKNLRTKMISWVSILWKSLMLGSDGISSYEMSYKIKSFTRVWHLWIEKPLV